MDGEFNLFNQGKASEAPLKSGPLAHQYRPQLFQEFIGIEEVISKYPFLNQEPIPSIIFYGPPGSGKTTLGHLLAKKNKGQIHQLSAVLGNVAELKKLMNEAYLEKEVSGNCSVIFIDEIHRFNKAQQDALLPRVEAGDFILIGATTENPKFALNNALLSRVHLVGLDKISSDKLHQILENALKRNPKFIACDGLLETILSFSNGDARRSLNILEMFLKAYPKGISESEWGKNEKKFRGIISQHGRDFDRKHDRHYHVISAFIKSMRGSDPNAAILWLAVMIDGGEDPLFIARRMILFASEDVGNADPWALTLATMALESVKSIGMPESRIILAQVATYLASTVKSNAAYLAIDEALKYVKERSTIEVPLYLRNQPELKGYKYPHDYSNHFVKQNYTNDKIPSFYRPISQGREKLFQERLKDLWGKTPH